MNEILIIGAFLVVLVLLQIVFFISRYKRCPSDKILVVYGKTSGSQSSKCYAGGATFVWPVIQDYRFLDLTPISIDVNLKNELSKDNVRVSVPAQFNVAISKKPSLMIAAAERLLALDQAAIKTLAHNIIKGQIKLMIGNLNIDEIISNRGEFIESVTQKIEKDLNKIGIEIINITDIDIEINDTLYESK